MVLNFIFATVSLLYAYRTLINHRLRYGGKNEATTYNTSKLKYLENGIFIYAYKKVTF